MSSSSKPPGGVPDTPLPEKKLTFEKALKTPPRGSPETSPPPSRSQSPLPKMTTTERSTPKIEPKLAEQHNYAEWILSIKQTLGLYDHEDESIWQIVTGDVLERGKNTTSIGGSTSGKADAKKLRQWLRDNDFAILTMKRNCEPEVVSIIELCENANETYLELQAKFEGRTIMDIGVILSSITKLTFDDRNDTIDDHLAEFDKKWNFMKASVANGKSTDKDEKEFGEILERLSKSDRAKAELLLISLPPFYSKLVENLRSKTGYTYGDIARQINLYVPQRQRGHKCEEGTKDGPIVLKSDSKPDNGKRCTYCQSKGWKGLNNEEKECFTMKRDEKRKKDKTANKNKVHEEEQEESDVEGDIRICQIKVRSAGNSMHEYLGFFMYDTGASHSTTNNKSLLTNIRSANLSVKGHDRTKTTCTTVGTMTIKHNGRTINHEETLYHDSYSNLISGQRLPPHTMTVEEGTAEIKLKGKSKALYKRLRDDDGGNWIKPDEEKEAQIGTLEEAREMHERYGYISYDTLKTLPQFPKIKQNPRCEACEKGKTTMPAAREQQQKIRTTQRLERLHVDLVAPITPVTPGKQY